MSSPNIQFSSANSSAAEGLAKPAAGAGLVSLFSVGMGMEGAGLPGWMGISEEHLQCAGAGHKVT